MDAKLDSAIESLDAAAKLLSDLADAYQFSLFRDARYRLTRLVEDLRTERKAFQRYLETGGAMPEESPAIRYKPRGRAARPTTDPSSQQISDEDVPF